MWKLYDFSVTQILRAINFEGARIAKDLILTHLDEF